jgi:TatD DNase family protein
MTVTLVDSHCHLDMLDVATAGAVNEVIDRARESGVCHFLNVCVRLDEFATLLATAEQYPFVSASVGLHPNENEKVSNLREVLLQHGMHPKVIAIGETGLDYFRSTGDLDWQRERFRTHIAVARELKKPLIIHTRDAMQDTLDILREENANEIGGVMHCFTGDWQAAQQALELGFYISFSGVVTFKNASVIQDTASKVPLDRMLIETDAPYLAPMPHRGKANEPGYVRHTAEFLANMRGVTLEEFGRRTTDNFYRLFTGAEKTYV